MHALIPGGSRPSIGRKPLPTLRDGSDGAPAAPERQDEQNDEQDQHK